ncbi:MAG: TPM domain-containing protein [Oscillospiraceae bacterium]|nr:TPM domain-containing protein [Oscillospiraceae bacterium]
MKKRLFSAILVLMLLLSMAVSVSAATDAFVYDEAGLLTEVERADLANRLARLSDTYNAQIVVVTIPSAEGNDPDAIVEYFYDNMGIGYGEGLDGVLLLVCMDPREYRILSNGYCADAISTGAIDDIGNAIVNDLSGGDYAEAFGGFADKCEYYLDGHLNGFPFDFGISIGIALLIGVLVGQIVGKVLKGQLKTVRREHRAQNYVKSGSMKLTEQSDTFLYRDVKKIKKDTNSGTRSSGGSSRSVGGGSF